MARLSHYSLPGLLAAAGCQLAPGPCEHRFEDPLINLEIRVAGPLHPSTFALTEFRLADRSVPPLSHWAGSPGYRVAIRGDTLFCDASCGFGTEEGRYEFRIGAEGFTDQAVAVTAAYAEFDGGCPSANRGGRTVAVTLSPALGLR